MANGTLHLPGCILGGVGLNTCGSWRAVIAVGSRDCECLATILGFLRETPPSNITITFEDFLGRDFGVLLE